MKITQNKERLFNSIRDLIVQSQKQIIRTVNQTILITYFEIGRMVTEEEQNGQLRADYAKEMLSNLSKNLTNEFGKGYSLTNLEYIRKFYKIYAKRIPQPVAGESISMKTKRKHEFLNQ